jgi:hypothetical protein
MRRPDPFFDELRCASRSPDANGDANKTAHYWPSSPWCFLLSCGSSRSINQLPLPFTLIGSHPLCGIRITDQRVPAVAYFACAFEDAVEVWPLCPIAFAQWGVVNSQHSILVGKHRIRLMHQTHPRWHLVSSVAAATEEVYSCFTDPRSAISLYQSSAVVGTCLDLQLEWGGLPHVQPMARRVLILGADHPSTLRLRGLGLATCDHALVAAGDAIWKVRLDLKANDQKLEDLVSKIRVGDEAVEIQRLRIAVLRGTTPDGESTDEVENLTPLPIRNESMNLIDTAEADGKSVNHKGNLASTQPAPRQAAASKTSDALTSGVTERLIQLARAKADRRRMLAFAAMLMMTMGLLALIIWQMLWPLVAKLTS